MTKFETTALELLRSIDETLKVLRQAAEREKRRTQTEMEQMADLVRSRYGDSPKK